MPNEIPNLSSNPLSVVRSFPLQLVPIDQIEEPKGIEIDEIFASRYSSFLRGKAPLHHTRISIDLIRRGFWKRSADEWRLVEDDMPSEALSYTVNMIRLGNRPPLHIYENPNPADDKRYVCADDMVIYLAYEKLGVSCVPVVLMGKPRDLEESAISVRYFSRGRKEGVPLIEGLVPITHELVYTLLGPERPAVIFALPRIIEKIRLTKSAVKRFHRPGSIKFHYHHTLYSILSRAEDCVESMRLLMEANKPLLAAALLRSLHELALMFYVDWIAPGHTYQYLQMASVQSEKEWEATCESWRKQTITEGASILEAKDIKDAHMRAFRLGSVVGERARIFPLGQDFQTDVYSFLSDIIHHDFSMAARYMHALDHGDEAVYHDDVEKTIVHLTDVLVAAIVVRIASDVGDKIG